MGIPVIIDDRVKDDIAALIQRARHFVLPYEWLRRFASGRWETPQILNKDATITLPVYRSIVVSDQDVSASDEVHGVHWEATFTLEEQMPRVPFRHLSVSCSVRGRMPNMAAMAVLMEEFGFVNGIEQTKSWIEEFPNNQGAAVNVIEPIDGDWKNKSPRSIVGLRYDPRIEQLWDSDGKLKRP